jgi:hypothetical protein
MPISSWYEDKNDRALNDLVPILEGLSQVDDVRSHMKKFIHNNEVNFRIAYNLFKNKSKSVNADKGRLLSNS